MRTEFGYRIKRIRKNRGWSQAQAAAKIEHLTKRTLQGWEAGRCTPPKWACELVLEQLNRAATDDVLSQ